jgi:hypothetical protein
MRISRKNFSQLMDGSLTSLPTSDSLSKGVGERTLIVEYPPKTPEGLGIQIVSSTTREKLFKHLLAKWCCKGFLRKSEKLIGAMLILVLRTENQIILDWIISHPIKKEKDRFDLWKELLPFVSHLPESPLSYLNAFEPEVFILKKWYHKTRIPAKRYIGIGYSDHGTLSTTLAWQEQMVGGEQEEVPSVEVKLILHDFYERTSPS